jgi:hypothetical protein
LEIVHRAAPCRNAPVTFTLGPSAKTVMHPLIRSGIAGVSLAIVALFGRADGGVSQSAGAASTPATTSVLYVLNDSGRTLFPSNQVVTDNDKEIVSLARQTYARLTIAPGQHVLRPEPYLWKQEVRLSVEPGATYFVVVAYKPERSWALPLAGPPLLLHELTEQEASPLLKDMKAQ